MKYFFKIYYPAIFILITLLSFTFYAYFQTSNSQKQRMQRQFEARVDRVCDIINKRMIDYIQILRGCKGLFNASGSVSNTEWKTYVNSLNIASDFKGIQGLAFSYHILISDTALLTRSLKSTNPQFQIRSSFTNSVLTPVSYIEPLDIRNQRAIGFDLYSEAIRKEAIDRAIATGRPALTRKITLMQETQTDIQPGCLLFMPVYVNNAKSKVKGDQHVLGFVSNVFRTHDLFGTLLLNFYELDIEVYDGENTDAKNLLYTSKSSAQANLDLESMNADTTLIIAGTPWKLIINANHKFGSTIERQQPYLILIIGLILSLLLFILALNTIKRRLEVAKELALTKFLELKKDEFIGIASHELKTPLTSIKATVQMLVKAETRDREKFLLSKANVNVDKLQKLIEDLLDVSKIQAGQLQLSVAPFLLKDLINESVENIESVYQSHTIIKQESIPDITVPGDFFRLEQSLINLLSNAIKYSPRGKEVNVNAYVYEQKVRIEVVDKGLGISKANQNKIFERFFRAEELSPVISGLGMGLYISNQIIKLHNGEIGVQSEIGKGSTFYIILPL